MYFAPSQRKGLELATPPLVYEMDGARTFWVSPDAPAPDRGGPAGRPSAAELRRAAGLVPRPRRRDGRRACRQRRAFAQADLAHIIVRDGLVVGGLAPDRTKGLSDAPRSRTTSYPSTSVSGREARGAAVRKVRGGTSGRPVRSGLARLKARRGPCYPPPRRRSRSGPMATRRAEIAQLVEHATENRGVASSTLALGTNNPGVARHRAEVAQW